jgi:hypothetical protein
MQPLSLHTRQVRLLGEYLVLYARLHTPYYLPGRWVARWIHAFLPSLLLFGYYGENLEAMGLAEMQLSQRLSADHTNSDY